MKAIVNGWFLAEPRTGSGRYATNLLHWLPTAEGADVMWIAPSTEHTRGKYRGRRDIRLVTVLGGPLGKIYFELVQFPAFTRIGRADVSHVPYWGLLPPCSRGARVVSMLDAFPLIDDAKHGLLGRVYYPLARRWTRSADIVITISETARKEVSSALGRAESEVAVTYLGVDHLETTPPSQGTVPSTGKYVLYLGGWSPRKNLGLVLRAYALDRACGTNNLEATPLIVAGGSEGRLPRRDDPRVQAEALGISDLVRFVGPVTEGEKTALLDGASLFVFPSKAEGFGLPPLEAMAAGIPVVAAANPAALEVLGDCAVFVDSDDPEGFRRAMTAVLENKERWDELHRKGLERAESFKWIRSASATHLAYATAVELRRR